MKQYPKCLIISVLRILSDQFQVLAPHVQQSSELTGAYSLRLPGYTSIMPAVGKWGKEVSRSSLSSVHSEFWDCISSPKPSVSLLPRLLPSFLQTLDGGLNVIQLETAVGAAIKSFENSLGINVPRSRFLPVKTTSDLLLVMSNLYSLNAGSLTMSEKREFPTVPLVKLGSSFTKVGNWKYT